ncbi:hypothetical protein E2C01_088493 [Portunus trituberculatus]|uniref:Uncharacterized protein n=1 Tax=Portunus trituberculatus TaxID=210409 RepID=A0A5B7JK09_PORTR|nr:hypothetical protein [Portunus trituberculatus]
MGGCRQNCRVLGRGCTSSLKPSLMSCIASSLGMVEG